MPTATFHSPSPDPDDDRDSAIALPPAVARLVALAQTVRARTDQSNAPPLDDRARELIRLATRKELPLEARAHIELNVIRYRCWAAAAAEESLRFLAESSVTGPGDGAEPA